MNAASASYLSNWLYVLYSIRVFEYLGILVVIISHMIYSLLPFLVLQFSIIFIFAMCGILSFAFVNSNFSSLYDAMLALFSAALGQFDIDTLIDDSLRSVLFLVSFLIITAILLLNLLIAILLEDYNKVKKFSRGYFLQQILSLDSLWEENPYAGALTFKQGPLVVINLLFVPFLALKLKPLNYTLEFFLYLPSLLQSTVLFLLIDLFYFLYSYCFIFRSLFLSPLSTMKPCTRLAKGVVLFLTYPLLLPPTLIRDLLLFIRNIFASEK